jgi:integrase
MQTGSLPLPFNLEVREMDVMPDSIRDAPIRRKAQGIATRLTEFTTKALQNATERPVRSISTKSVVVACLTTFGRFLDVNRFGNLSCFPREALDIYAELRRKFVSRSQLKNDLFALKIAFGYVPYFTIGPAVDGGPRAYSPEQIEEIKVRQAKRYRLATDVAVSTGIRALELITIARLEEQPPDNRHWPSAMHDGKGDGRLYSVKGKGGLVRTVFLPTELADRLESTRRATPVQVRNNKIFYWSRYEMPGGKRWSDSFSRACKRRLGASAGGHGTRHGYAQERYYKLLSASPSETFARRVLSAELGHFRPQIVPTYLRGRWNPAGSEKT